MPALVSAIIPTKNRLELLQRALKSVINQTYNQLEIIVVDDGSGDGTQAFLEEFQKKIDLRVKIISNDDSVGAARARNQAVEQAEGTFIAGLDDDDVWHEKRIEALVEAHSDGYSCVTSDVVMAYPALQKRWKKKKIIDYQTLLYTNQVGNQVLVRRDRLVDVGGYDVHLKAAQDYDLWIRLTDRYGAIFNVQESLQTIFMDHEEERITDHSAFEGYLQFYNKHKHRFNAMQRKYQLYNIRRAQGKPESLGEFLSCVPRFRYGKEIKRMIMNKINR